MRKVLLFFALGLVFLALIFTLKTRFSCAGVAEISESYNVDSLKIQYAQSLEKLAGLLKQKLEALNYQEKNGLSMASSTTRSVLDASSSQPAMNHQVSSENLPYYFPSWHLIPGQCAPKYY